MIALLLLAAQAVHPPAIPAPQPAAVPMPPQDWSALPPLRVARRSGELPDVSAFVRTETLAGRCARAARTAHGWTLTVDLAVLAAPGGRVRRVTPRAIDCPTVEQYAAGLVLRAARDAVDTGDATTETWYRTAMTFAWEHVTLSDDELARYARHIVLKEFGGSGQTALKAASVAIVGAGGIGSPAIQYLAAAGVGRLVLIDDDSVEPSNLQRQTIFRTADTGRAKVQAAAAAAAAINPHVVVETHAARIDAANVDALLGRADVVLDGCDNFATRFVVADSAHAHRQPLISAAVGQFEGQLATYRGWEADRPCYRCFVGEDPERSETSCAEDGVLGPVTGVLGSLAALEVLRAISPFGDDPAGKLLLVDLLGLRFRTIRLPKDPGCRACGVPPT